jgi:hypothetical protein
MYKW